MSLWNSTLPPADHKKITLLNKPFEALASEEALLPSNYFDIVFTSPPFLEYEVYSDKNPTYKNWEKDFYEPLVAISRRVLKDGGLIAYHIDDTSAGPAPAVIRHNAIEVWGVDVGFGKRVARTWIIEKPLKPKPQQQSSVLPNANVRGRGVPRQLPLLTLSQVAKSEPTALPPNTNTNTTGAVNTPVNPPVPPALTKALSETRKREREEPETEVEK
jgi:hypothetical protein